MKNRRWLIFAILFFTVSEVFAAARYAETLIAKDSGSAHALVMRAASVYVYSPGASANCSSTCSGTTITVYDSSNIQDGDTLEIGSSGLTATVLDVPTATTILVNTTVTWQSQDRFLRTNAQISIYRDEGGTVPIVQPTLSDTNGRVLFFVDTSVTTALDIKAVASTQGLRYINPGVAFVQTGSSAGGWTDSGTSVSLTTSTDRVHIGGTGATAGRLVVYSSDAEVFTTAVPAAYGQLWRVASGSAFWGVWLASNGMLCWNDGTKSLACYGTGTPQAAYFGDMAGVDVASAGTLNVKTQAASQRGMVVKGSTSQSANLYEGRDVNSNVLFSVSPAGAIVGASSAVTGAASSATLSTSGAATIGGALTVAGLGWLQGQLKWGTLTYTAPTVHGTGSLTNDGAGVLTWSAGVAGTCYQNASTFARLNPFGANSVPTFYNMQPNITQGDFSGTFYPVSHTTCTADAETFRTTAGMTVKNFYVDTSVAVSVGTVFTVLKNCTDTAVTCTIAFGQSACTDTTHSVAFAVGDRVAIKATPQGSLSPVSASFAFCWAR